MPTRLLIAAVLTLCTVISGAAVQAPPAKAVSTASGVFTSAQASRGEQTYMSICGSCHPRGSYTTNAFRQKWDGAPLSELFGLISQTMPKDAPGTLTPDEYIDVVAYLLRLNGSPAGKADLRTELKTLKRIRISFAGTKAKDR